MPSMSGERGVANLLRSQGFSDVSDIMGGYGAWAPVHAVAS